MGLSTHILDTVHGRPAAGVRVELWSLDGERRLRVRRETDADGRIRGLLDGSPSQRGRYELVFDVAPYFRALGVTLPDPPFLDRITIAFGIASEDAHYHVPLLVSPWSYATYRGS